MSVSEQLDRFRAVVAGPSNDAIERWKAEGRPVIGYSCSFVPVELLAALGALPLRLRGAGSRDSSTADVWLSSRTCSAVRQMMTLVLEGRYGFLDGEVSLNTCDHVRRAYDVWRHKSEIGWHGFISVPRNARESLLPYFREELARLRGSLEEHFAVEIDDERLRRAIGEQNEVRRRLAAIDRLRSGRPAALSGAEVLLVAVAARVLPAADFIAAADALLDAVAREGRSVPEPRARLLLVGGALDDEQYVAAIEAPGAQVVADQLCFGLRPQRLTAVDASAGDPLDTLARHYFFATPCARMIGNFPDRVDQLQQLVGEREIDGVVLQRLKFCDPWGGEAHNLRRRLRERDLPLLVLEREYGAVHSGQVRTRAQAFIELIEARARRASAADG